MSTESLTNRHIAKLLDNLESLTDMPPLAKTAVKQEMWYLSEDVQAERQVKQGEASYESGQQ